MMADSSQTRIWGRLMTLTAELLRRIQAVKMSCYRKILHISYKNDRKETQTAVVWSCCPFIRSGQNHLARHSERGKKTRQTEEEVEDNIGEWTDLEFGKSQRAVEKREKWRKLVAKLSVVLQRPSRLRD